MRARDERAAGAWYGLFLAGLAVIIGAAVFVALEDDGAPTPEEQARLDSIAKVERPAAAQYAAWRYHVGGAPRSGGMASTTTNVRPAGGSWAKYHLRATCTWAAPRGKSGRLDLRFHYPGARRQHASNGATDTRVAVEIDGESLATSHTRTETGHVGFGLPLAASARLAAGDTVRVRHVNALGTTLGEATFALSASAKAFGPDGLAACNWAKVERLRAVESRRLAEARRAEERRNNACTNGAKFERLAGTWYFQRFPPKGDWVPVRSVAPNDYNNIVRRLELIGAGDPVLYRDANPSDCR